MFSPVQHADHVTDSVIGTAWIDSRVEDAEDPEYGGGGPPVRDPVAILRQYAPSPEAWDATDPSHRGCFIGQPCRVTEKGPCARITYLSKFYHAYGTCRRWGPDHVYCDTSLDDKRSMFPDCAECGVLVEIWDLVLVNRRLLQDKQVLTAEDYRLVQGSICGYVEAYKVRRAAHVAELRSRADDVFEARVKLVKEGIKAPVDTTTSWWLLPVSGVVAALARGYRRFRKGN
ncbi:hypothetical protein LY76DRAFT_650543 [Colletotrichum caudatum]|nr:hypothetical protein LY76DRAFT_650543 [Colletotrichum caudatum]